MRQTVLLKQQPNNNMLLPPGTKGVANKFMPNGFNNTVVADGWGPPHTHLLNENTGHCLSVSLTSFAALSSS